MNFAEFFSSGALLLSSGSTFSQENFSNIATPVRYSSAEYISSIYNAKCEGRDYFISIDQVNAVNSPDQKINLISLMINSEEISVQDREIINNSFRTYNIIFGVSLQCSGNVLGVSFLGRRENDGENSSTKVWFNGLQVSRID